MEVNLSEHNLVGRRVVRAYIESVGGLKNVVVTKEMMAAANQAGHNYMQYLENEKRNDDPTSRKRKKQTEDLDDIKAKKSRMEKQVASLKDAVDSLMDRLTEATTQER